MLIQITTQVEKRTTSTHTLQINREQLLWALAQCGVEVPKGAEVWFRVPGGADWSNTAIDIEDDHPIHIRWTEETTEKSSDA